MDTVQDSPAPRVRERSAKPMRAPWTYRCRLTGPNVTVDVDAFSIEEAAAAAAAQWDVECDAVEVEGRRRWWMRWLGVSTHDAAGRRLAMDRDWWYSAKLAAVVLVALTAAWVVHLAIP